MSSQVHTQKGLQSTFLEYAKCRVKNYFKGRREGIVGLDWPAGHNSPTPALGVRQYLSVASKLLLQPFLDPVGDLFGWTLFKFHVKLVLLVKLNIFRTFLPPLPDFVVVEVKSFGIRLRTVKFVNLVLHFKAAKCCDAFFRSLSLYHTHTHTHTHSHTHSHT